MNFQLFKRHFSDHRINRYLKATEFSEQKTIQLYRHNLLISSSFNPLLGVLEVVLRNNIDLILSDFFKDKNWILNQRKGFMSDPSLNYKSKRTNQFRTNDFLKTEVTKAENKLIKSGGSLSKGNIISEQTIGFWTSFFEVQHYKILKGKPIQIFHQLPNGFGRKEVSDELTKIRRFRNRIYHNEPICFIENRIDFSETIDVYDSIIKVLYWLDPYLIDFINDLDRVKDMIQKSNELI